VTEAEIQGIPSSKVEDALDKLIREGQLFEPGHGKIRMAS
jgi:hypothetical protein